MKDAMTILLSGVENIAKNMKEYIKTKPAINGKYDELEYKIERLTDRVDRLVELMERRLGEPLDAVKPRSKRMMDIKQRIHDVIAKHPEGIRPPQIAQVIGTRVQNLYPHLKAAIGKKQLLKDKTGTYSLADKKSTKKK